jgi:DNA-binding IclR family transcriptional regulator
MVDGESRAIASRETAPKRDRRSLAPVGLQMLRVLTQRPEGIGISELGRATGLEVAQAHRAVRELVAEGWIAQSSPNGTYQLTGSLLALAAMQLASSDLRTVAIPIMRRLKHETGMTVVLAEFRSGQLVCVARELSEAPVVTWAQIGDAWPLGSAAAVAIAFEAAARASDQTDLLPETYLPDSTRLAELDEYATRGWSLDESRYRPGGYAVGAAIFDMETKPVGALALAWARDVIAIDQVESVGASARAGAREISRALGHREENGRASWRLLAEAHQEDLFRHLADLRARTYEGAVGRDAQRQRFAHAARLLAPVVTDVLTNVSDRWFDGSGVVSQSESDTEAEGTEVRWSLSWPDQQVAVTRAGAPLAPISVVARLRPAHLHGHLGGSYFGDWPMQILTPDDARRQAPIVVAIVEAEMHQRIFESGGEWRLVPAFCDQIGEQSLAGPAPVDGGGSGQRS